MAPKKNQKMSLGTFLQDETLGSWADEMEDMPLPEPSRPTYGTDRRAFSTNTGMGGGSSFERRDNYQPREQLPLPTSPPYTAHLANLSFDATELDVKDFFRECQVTNVRIVEDKLDRKPKGFGYVEFGSLDGLKAALAMTGGNLSGRQVRVRVADPPKDRQESRDFSNWERKGPLADLPGQQRRVSDRPGFNRSYDNMSDAGSERGGPRRGFGGDSDGKIRDFSSWERKGPLSPGAGPSGLSLRDGGRQGSTDGAFRRNSPSWGEARREGRGDGQGEGRSAEGSRPRREYADRPIPERQPTAADMDNQWRARMRPDAPAAPAATPSPDASIPSSPQPSAATTAAPPTTRPRLNLQKRTVSEANPDAGKTTSADSKASPFGAARPVDTAAKEREAEEKLQLAIRQKREADEKARAEKAEEKKLAKEKGELERRESSTKVTKEKETDEADDEEREAPQSTPKFEVLRRADSNTNDMIADEDNDDENEGQAEDKAVKPKEITRDVPTKANGTWRKGSEPAKQSTGEALEEDGWSTVSKPSKQRNNRRNNNAASRAIAS